jgi:hypothetical protein
MILRIGIGIVWRGKIGKIPDPDKDFRLFLDDWQQEFQVEGLTLL